MKSSLLPALLLMTTSVFSQSAADALRYAYLQPGGTARYVGAGNAFGALGADFGALSHNPAGLAMYRGNELTVTPSLMFARTTAHLPNGFPTDDSDARFRFNNVGLVFSTTPNAGNWKTFNFGIGYNQLSNYVNAIYNEGNADGTIMNGWFDEAQQNGSLKNLDPFGSALAASDSAIYHDANNNLTYDFADDPNANIGRSQSLLTSGSMNEMVFSFAGNYDEKLMLGATFGVPFVRYQLDGIYTEYDPDGGLEGVVPYFDNLRYTEYLHTDGVGFNMKFGLIYRLSQAVRLGASFHTPTWFALTDNYSNSLTYTYEDGNGVSPNQAFSPNGVFSYGLATPWRAMVSGAFVINKSGFISGDVEWVDYKGSKFNFNRGYSSPENTQAEQQENSAIRRDYRTALNVRVGGELALEKLRLRGGVSLLGNPNAGATDFNMGYSGGIGYHAKSVFVDFAYRWAGNDGYVTPYADAPKALTSTTTNDFMVTVGFKF